MKRYTCQICGDGFDYSGHAVFFADGRMCKQCKDDLLLWVQDHFDLDGVSYDQCGVAIDWHVIAKLREEQPKCLS